MPEDPPRRRRKLSAILMADVSGFSRLMGADEDGTIDLVKDFQERARSLVEGSEGRVVDTAGDSIFAEFDSVVNAVRCAHRIQEEQKNANAARPGDRKLEARIGVHLGDVVVEDYRVYGDGVNIAARLEPLADPGGICVSEAVYQQVRGRLELPFEEFGLHELKNIEHPLRLYRVPPATDGGVPKKQTAPPSRSTQTKGAAAPAGDLMRVRILVPGTVAFFLLPSEILLFPSAGVLPFVGTLLLGVLCGWVWSGRTGAAGHFLLALGAAITTGALWTDWSQVTNVLFVLAGAIVAAVGLGLRGRSRSPKLS